MTGGVGAYLQQGAVIHQGQGPVACGVGLCPDVPMGSQGAWAQGHLQLGPGGFVSPDGHSDVVVGGYPQRLKWRPCVLEGGVQAGTAAAGCVDVGPGESVPRRYLSRQAGPKGVDQEGAIQGKHSWILPPRKAR